MASIEEITKLIRESKDDMNACFGKLIKEGNHEINERLDKTNTSLEGLATRISTIEKEIEDVKVKTNTIADDMTSCNVKIGILEEKLSQVEYTIQSKDDEIYTLKKQVEDQIDRGMRETLSINGISGNENTWKETKITLSKYIEELSDNILSVDSIKKQIVRAHRGKNRKSIFVKFNNSHLVQQVKDLGGKSANSGIYINKTRSPQIMERIKAGIRCKKLLKEEDESKEWKLYVNDQVQLMVKKPGDTSYTVYLGIWGPDHINRHNLSLRKDWKAIEVSLEE